MIVSILPLKRNFFFRDFFYILLLTKIFLVKYHNTGLGSSLFHSSIIFQGVWNPSGGVQVHTALKVPRAWLQEIGVL